MNSTKIQQLGNKIDKIRRLQWPFEYEENGIIMEDGLKHLRVGRSRLIWALWDLFEADLCEFSFFVRCTVFRMSEKEFGAAIGLKPSFVKKN